MNKIILGFNFLLIFSGLAGGSLLASETPSPTAGENPIFVSTLSPTETPLVTKPIVLKGSDKVNDSEYHSIPQAPKKDSGGKPLRAEKSDQIPLGAAINNLTDPTFLSQIPDFNKTENKSKSYYWHSWKGLDYCHYRDGSGNHWYGWQWGENFLWAFFKAGHFWWHDTYAERWLYFDRGYWRWQGTKKDQFQVYLENGHYYACDINGVLGEDLFTLGTEEVVTQPVTKETPSTRNRDEDSSPSTGGMGALSH